MGRFIVKRLSEAILTLWVLSLVIFLSVRLTGDPAAYLLGPEGGQAEYEQAKRNLGLDRPLIDQYGIFLGNVVRGDFGRSIIMARPVRDLVVERLGATLQLTAAAFALSVVIGIPLGVMSAVRRGRPIDVFAKLFAFLGMAAPNFWVGIMLIVLFGVVLGWLPTSGSGDLAHLILPAFVLGWQGMAGMVRLGRSAMLDVLDSDHVRFARMRGLPERLVVYRHALKNAAIPLVSFLGLTLAALLNGSVVVEVVFAWPGIGRLMLQGVTSYDFSLVQGMVLVAGLLYITMALIVDVLYAYLDPRIRFAA